METAKPSAKISGLICREECPDSIDLPELAVLATNNQLDVQDDVKGEE